MSGVVTAPGFDVSAYRVIAQRNRRRIVRVLIGMAVVFLLSGAASGLFASGGQLNGTFLLFVCVFAVGAAVPVAFLFALHPRQYLRSVGADGPSVALRVSNGKVRERRWEELGMGVLLREVPVASRAAVGISSAAWWLCPIPLEDGGFVGQDGADAIRDAAPAAGAATREERFDENVRGPPRSEVPVRELAYSRWFPSSPTLAGPGPPPLPSDPSSLATFPFWEFTAPDSRPRPASAPTGQGTVSETGVLVRPPNGAEVRIDWNAPRIDLELWRHRASGLAPIDFPTGEGTFQGTAPKFVGRVPAEFRAALERFVTPGEVRRTVKKQPIPGGTGNTVQWLISVRLRKGDPQVPG